MPKKSKLDAPDLAEVVARHTAVSDVLRYYGIEPKGGSFKTFARVVKARGISTAHFVPHYAKVNTTHRGRVAPVPDAAVFIENSPYSRKLVRDRLIERGAVPYCCAICGSNAEWRGKPMPLMLDHINGVPDDHRLENLRFTCANCNAQLETFAGRNIGKRKLLAAV